ncbi:hypothetical protein evm_012248 [Chilo suppressalis]|nr:hypothetical protein evm_012248 [Chilo suppressalis]
MSKRKKKDREKPPDDEIRDLLRPTRTVAITFASSTSLPDYVFLKMWRLPVLPYVPPAKQCFRCLSDHQIHIALISETWLKPNIKFDIRGYTVVRNDSGNNHNGVAIIIHNSIHFQNITTFSDSSIQNIGIKIQIHNKSLHIVRVSFYCPPRSNPSFSKLKLVNLIKSISKPMILAGDFNAHHTVWGCASIDSRSRDLIDIIEENDLVLLNNGSPNTIGLDLTMVSSNLALSCEWQVCDTPLGGYVATLLGAGLPHAAHIRDKNVSTVDREILDDRHVTKGESRDEA